MTTKQTASYFQVLYSNYYFGSELALGLGLGLG